MKPISFWMISFLTPLSSSFPRRISQLGSTLVDVKPFSESYPICATWTKCVGLEIIDLSILPLLFAFFFFFSAASANGGVSG